MVTNFPRVIKLITFLVMAVFVFNCCDRCKPKGSKEKVNKELKSEEKKRLKFIDSHVHLTPFQDIFNFAIGKFVKKQKNENIFYLCPDFGIWSFMYAGER